MTTQIVKSDEKTTSSQVALPDAGAAWGTEDISYTDIGKVYLSIVQKQIMDREDIRIGDIVKTNTMEVVGTAKKPVELMFVKHFKEWLVMNLNGEVKERALYIDGKNDMLKEGVMPTLVDGEECKRYLTHNFFALMVGREHEGPVIVSFKKSNKRIAEGLLATIKANGKQGKSIASQTFFLTTTPKQFNKFHFYVYSVLPGKNTTPEVENMAKNLYLEIQKSFNMAASSTPASEEEAPF